MQPQPTMQSQPNVKHPCDLMSPVCLIHTRKASLSAAEAQKNSAHTQGMHSNSPMLCHSQTRTKHLLIRNCKELADMLPAPDWCHPTNHGSSLAHQHKRTCAPVPGCSSTIASTAHLPWRATMHMPEAGTAWGEMHHLF